MGKDIFKTIRYFAKNMAIVIGLVLIWRGIWYVLDYFDMLEQKFGTDNFKKIFPDKSRFI